MILKLGKKKPILLGIDISSTSVKLIELRTDGNRYRVESFGIEPLPAQVVVDKNIVDTEQVGEAIARVLKKSRPSSRMASVAVAGSAVITKIIEMEGDMTDDEREMQIRFDADQYIPYPLSEVNMDFEVIGPSFTSPGRVNVLLAASRSEHVEQRQDALQIGGLVPKVVDIEAYAMERAFTLVAPHLENEPEVVAIVDIGHTITTLHVIHDGVIIYTREQMFGGKLLTEDIMRRYGLNFEEANKAKQGGNLPDDYAVETLIPYIESVVQQVSRALSFFFSSSQYNDVDHIVLAGGGAAIPGLANMVSGRLGNPVTVANPFLDMSFSSGINVSTIETEAPALMIACGLALRSFD